MPSSPVRRTRTPICRESGRGSRRFRRSSPRARRRRRPSPEELKRLELQLEIAQQRGGAPRGDARRLRAAARRDRAERGGLRGVLRSGWRARSWPRARLLHRFGRFGYFRVLLEADDVPAFLAGVERLDRLARRDGRLLARYRQVRGPPGGRPRAGGGAEGRDRPALRAARREDARIASLKARARESPRARDRAPRPPAGARSRRSPTRPRASSGCSRGWRGQSEAAGLPVPPAGSVPGRACSTGRRAGRSSRRSGGTAIRSSTPGRSPTASRSRCPPARPCGRSTRQGDLRPVARGVRKPRDPRPRRRCLHALRLAAGGRRSCPALRSRRRIGRESRAGDPAATSPASTSRSGTARRPTIRWPG